MNNADFIRLFYHLSIIGFAVGLLLLFAATMFRNHRGLVLTSMLMLVISGTGGSVAYFAMEPVEDVADPDFVKDSIRFVAHLSSITTFFAVLVTAVICGAMFLARTKRGKSRHF